MPSGPRIRDNGVLGTTTDNPLTAGAGTFNSAGLANLEVVAAAHAVVTLDPLREFGEPEIVIITTHTAAATVATITRAAYGTVARSHPQGTLWVHAAVDEDFMEIVTTGTLPTDPYRGQPVFDTTLNAPFIRDTNDAWRNFNMLADPPACRVAQGAAQSLTDEVITTLTTFNVEIFDVDSMHNTAVNSERITFNTAGLYIINADVTFQAAADYVMLVVQIRANGVTGIAQQTIGTLAAGPAADVLHVSTLYKATAGQYVEVRALQNNEAGDAARTAQCGDFSAVWVGRG